MWFLLSPFFCEDRAKLIFDFFFHYLPLWTFIQNHLPFFFFHFLFDQEAKQIVSKYSMCVDGRMNKGWYPDVSNSICLIKGEDFFQLFSCFVWFSYLPFSIQKTHLFWLHLPSFCFWYYGQQMDSIKLFSLHRKWLLVTLTSSSLCHGSLNSNSPSVLFIALFLW